MWANNIPKFLASPAAWFSLCLLAPSTGIIQQYFGNYAVAAYVVVGCGGIFTLPTLLSHYKPVRQLSDKQALWLAALTFAGLCAVFAILYPIAQSGAIGGGSDGDDALNIAVRELLHGRYPYYQTTYLGNRLQPLPGAVIFAVPFVLLGNSAYQNFFWLAAFFWLVGKSHKSFASSLVLLWTVLAFSPIVMQNLVTGTDRVYNPIYILVFMRWLVRAIAKPDASQWEKVLPAVFLGIGLSSRANFILILPPLFSALAQAVGWRSALQYFVVIGASLIAITIPFWLYDPQGFAPFFVQGNKVAQFSATLPFADKVIPLSATAIAIGLSWRRMGSDCIALFRACAITQAFLVLSFAILDSLQSGTVSLHTMGYGPFFLFFGAVASWGGIIGLPKPGAGDSPS